MLFTLDALDHVRLFGAIYQHFVKKTFISRRRAPAEPSNAPANEMAERCPHPSWLVLRDRIRSAITRFPGNQVGAQFEPLGHQLARDDADASEITARRQAVTKPSSTGSLAVDVPIESPVTMIGFV